MAKPSRGGRRGGGGGGSNLPMVIPQPAAKPKATPGGIQPPETPHSAEDSVLMVNKDNYWKGEGYQVNCQRCIWAYEMNRRGYNVEALPNNDNFGAYDRWMSIAKNANKEWAFEDPWARGLTNAKAAKNIKTKMAEWGEGSRGVIQMARRSHSGHVFNVEYKNGKVTVFEAQTGEVHSSLSKYLSQQKAVPAYVRFFRTDNLDLNTGEFPKYVKQRG